MSRKNCELRKEQRQKEALIRQEAWARLSPKDQLQALDARLGKDEGAQKQRKKLASLS